jgi:hypothetical protein
MKKFAIVLCLVAIAGGLAIAAEKPYQAPIDFSMMKRVPCNLTSVAHDWDFSVNDQGFTTATCDATGGAEVWEWGTSTIAGAPGTVWGTILTGNYPVDSGQGLVSPMFAVTASSDLMEISHYVDTETNFDGGNVVNNADDALLTPTTGYPATINTSTSYYAYCVDNEAGYTGHAAVWATECFDLSAYTGSSIQVRFDFGSDASVTYPGWYLAYVRIGDDFIPVELQSFDVE